MKIFLSYSTLDKKVAGIIKEQLDDYGFYSFLAHDDIQPTEEWLNLIVNEIIGCDIFMLIITKNCRKSFWVNQEIGIAYGSNKLIVPVNLEGRPFGFISPKQHLSCSDYINFPIQRLILALDNITSISSTTRDFMIEKLKTSVSFDDSLSILRLISKFGNLDKYQIDNILKHAIKNDQIYRAYYAKNEIYSIINKYNYKNSTLINKLHSLS